MYFLSKRISQNNVFLKKDKMDKVDKVDKDKFVCSFISGIFASFQVQSGQKL